MQNMLIAKKVLAICLLAIPIGGLAHERAATGPVERVQKSGQMTITVLGQTFATNNGTNFAIDGQQVSSATAAKALKVQQEIYIEGRDQGTQTVASVVNIFSNSYVAGASRIYLLGTVEEFSQENGSLRMGSLFIDSSTMDPERLASMRVGSVLEISGIQPLPRGQVVEAELLSIGGSGRHSLGVVERATQLQSVGGSGYQLQSVGGSGVLFLSIGGSGLQNQSVGGSGVQLQSVGGSGFLN